MGVQPAGNSTSSHVSLVINDSYSESVACFHCAEYSLAINWLSYLTDTISNMMSIILQSTRCCVNVLINTISNRGSCMSCRTLMCSFWLIYFIRFLSGCFYHNCVFTPNVRFSTFSKISFIKNDITSYEFPVFSFRSLYPFGCLLYPINLTFSAFLSRFCLTASGTCA